MTSQFSQDSREHGMFPTTHWSELARAADWNNSAVGNEALGQTFQKYSGPMATYLKLTFGELFQWAGMEPEDLVQDFFREQVLEKDFIRSVRQSNGSKFRSFLRVCLYRFAISKIRKVFKKSAIKPDQFLHLDALDSDKPDEKQNRPDTQISFDIQWYGKIVSSSLNACLLQTTSRSQALQIEAFQLRYLNPLLSGSRPASISELMDKLGISSQKDASLKAIRGRKQFKDRVRKEINSYCVTHDEIVAEEKHLVFTAKSNICSFMEAVHQNLHAPS